MDSVLSSSDDFYYVLVINIILLYFNIFFKSNVDKTWTFLDIVSKNETVEGNWKVNCWLRKIILKIKLKRNVNLEDAGFTFLS